MIKRAGFLGLLIIASAVFGVKVGSTGENIYMHGGKTGVNVDTTDIPDAVFEVRSEDDGILIPRLTIVQRDAIVDPALGLLIYNSDCGLFNYFDGESWIPFPNLTGLDAGPIDGVTATCESATFVEYSIDPVDDAITYEWTLPAYATILSGDGTTTISVDFGSESGRICVTAVTPCGSVRECMDITVNPAPVGGAVTGGGTISLGESTGTLTLSGHSGSVNRWMKRLDSGVWTDIAYTGTTYSETPTSSGVWDYCAVIESDGCPAAISDYTTVTVEAPVSDTIVFTYTGAEQTWIVPAGITSIDIECRGAQGGGGSNGGQGGVSTGTLAVTPGETLYIYVGEQPITVTSGIGPGGFNGGGFGFWQPGGGGASDVRQGGNAYSDRVIVAGGGGGQYSSYRGGHGGGTTGENATWTNNGNLPYGGSQTEGGRWGSGFGTGGTGGSAYNAGGGGGGWYGGGSGENIVTNVTGAGGSGYIGGVTSGVTTQGGNSGDGEVIISW